jgi:hypothetical protein
MKPAIYGLAIAAAAISSPATAAPCTLAGLAWMTDVHAGKPVHDEEIFTRTGD